MAHRVNFPIDLNQILNKIGDEFIKHSGNENVSVLNTETLIEGQIGVLSFCKDLDTYKPILETYSNSIVLINKVPGVDVGNNNLFIEVKNPRLAYCKILGDRVHDKNSNHSTAVISIESEISEGCSVGAYSFIGKAKIGKNTKIGNRVTILDNVEIGDNCLVMDGVTIGSEGFGFEADQNGKYFRMPHFGGVIIGNDVRIGCNTCVDRGTFINTIIEDGVKIDNLVQIGHNSHIGRDSIIVTQSEVSGSVKIGSKCWISPGVKIVEGLSIGDGAFIGIGAIVTENIKPGTRLIPVQKTLSM